MEIKELTLSELMEGYTSADNGEKYISEQIDSILQQTHKEISILIRYVEILHMNN